MKKLMSLLTALSMVFALSACGSGQQNAAADAAGTEEAVTEDAAPDDAEDGGTEDGGAEEDGQNPVMNFVGPYASDRAQAMVEASGAEDAKVTIEWGSSAWEMTRWVMSGRLDGDTLTVAYTDCVKTNATYGDDGSLVSEEVEYENGTGTITFTENQTFTWHDDQSEGEDMVFEWSFTAPDDTDETAEGADAAADGTDAAAVELSAETEAAYQAKIEAARQDLPDGAELFCTVIPCGTGEPVLVIAAETYGPEDAREAMEAEIYQYAGGEVKHLGAVSSTGTAYPLSYTDEAVLFGGNHTAGKLVIHNGTAELYRLVNMNIEGETAVLEEYSVSSGSEILESSQEIASEDEASYDYYTNAFADETAQIIEFS